MDRARPSRARTRTRIPWGILSGLGVFLAASLWIVQWNSGWAPGVGFLDGLAVGAVIGATGLVRTYDDSWDEFWETTALTAVFGVFAIAVYWARREQPSAFVWVESAASLVGWLMLLFVPMLVWVSVDVLLFFGTFLGWFFSGILRPGYE